MKWLVVIAALGFCTAASADTASDIVVEEVRIAALERDLAPLVAPLQRTRADLRVFASLDPIVAAVSSLNHLSASQRTVSLRSTSRNGYIIYNNALCNSFAELQGNGDLNAHGELTAFTAAIQNDGSIVLSSHASTTGHIQVHVQFFGPRIYPPWPLPRGGGACPYGGGNGTSVGASFSKDLDLHTRFAFAMAPDGQSLTYRALLYDPTRVDVTISIGLGGLGSYGYPTSFNIPQTPYTSQFPLLIAKGGKVTLLGRKGSREYAIVLMPAAFAATKTGLAVEWNSSIAFHGRSAAK